MSHLIRVYFEVGFDIKEKCRYIPHTFNHWQEYGHLKGKLVVDHQRSLK